MLPCSHRSMFCRASVAVDLAGNCLRRSFQTPVLKVSVSSSSVSGLIIRLANSTRRPAFAIPTTNVAIAITFVSLLIDRQLFRNSGNARGVRTFMQPFNKQGIVHGTSSVLMSHAHLLARAAALFDQPAWRAPAERLLHWCLGHNVLNRSLFSGTGYRQPIGYSFRIPQIPEAMVVGFIGRPDDSPYLEESTAIE